MNRLDRYIFRQGFVPFLLILACTTAVIWLTQVLQKVDLMVEDGGSLVSFIKVTVLLIPSLVGVIVPFALLAAVLYAINLLAVDNEMPVISGAGASRLRVARPLIILSLFASLLVFIINVDLQPRSYRVLKETVEAVRSDVARSLIRSGVFTELSPGVTVYAEEARPGDQYIGLLIHNAKDPKDPVTYTAERGLFQVTANGPRLLLARGTWQRIDPDTKNVEILRFIETSIDLGQLDEGEGPVRQRETTERYISELFAPDMTNPWEAENAGKFRAEAHSRIATSLYPLAFALMALAVMLSAPVSRGGYGKRLLWAAGIAIILRVTGYVLQNAGSTAAFANLLQYIVPIMAIVISSVFLVGKFWKVKRRPPPALETILDNPHVVTPS
ncbi:MAG: LptF/LptG family permease, partial [Pseudomonadota bacterium]